MTEQAPTVEMESPQDYIPAPSAGQRVRENVVNFLKSRLPGEKTTHNMRQMDKLISHLPPNAQDLATKLRPVIKAGMYAGNCVGTYMEAMLAASVGLGVVLIGKEGLRMIPVSPGSTEMKRKGLGGVWKDLNIGSIPKSLLSAIRPDHAKSWKGSENVAIIISDTIRKRNYSKKSTAESLHIWVDALQKNPHLIREDDFDFALRSTLVDPFLRASDGKEGLIFEAERAADIFYISHPEAPETEQLKNAYQVLNEIGPQLKGRDRFHFVNQMHSFFSTFGHMMEYATPLLDTTLSMARSVLEQSDLPSGGKPYTQRTVETLESIKNNTYEYRNYKDMGLGWTHHYNPNLSRYPTTPYR